MRKALIATMLASAVMLSACGGGTKESGTENLGNNTKEVDTETEEADSESEETEEAEYTLSQLLNTDPILFDCREGNIGKDLIISNAYVFHDGVVDGYDLYDITLGDVSKMSDEEITDFFDEKVAAGDIDKFYDGEKYVLFCDTDDSGNNVRREVIQLESGGSVILDEEGASGIVYDSYYAGFETMGDPIIARVAEGTDVIFDTVDTEGIVLDADWGNDWEQYFQ